MYLCTTDIYSLIEYSSFVESLFILISIAGLLFMRWQRPNMIRPIRVCTFCCCVLRSRLCFCHIISLFFLMFPFCSVFFSAPFSWFSALFFLFFSLPCFFNICFVLLFSVLFFSVIYLYVYLVFFFQKLYLFFSCIVTELFVVSFFLFFSLTSTPYFIGVGISTVINIKS